MLSDFNPCETCALACCVAMDTDDDEFHRDISKCTLGALIFNRNQRAEDRGDDAFEACPFKVEGMRARIQSRPSRHISYDEYASNVRVYDEESYVGNPADVRISPEHPADEEFVLFLAKNFADRELSRNRIPTYSLRDVMSHSTVEIHIKEIRGLLDAYSASRTEPEPMNLAEALETYGDAETLRSVIAEEKRRFENAGGSLSGSFFEAFMKKKS